MSFDETGTFNAYWLPVDASPAILLTRSTTNATFAESAFRGDGRVLVSSNTGGNELTHFCVRTIDGVPTYIIPGEKLKAEFVG